MFWLRYVEPPRYCEQHPDERFVTDMGGEARYCPRCDYAETHNVLGGRVPVMPSESQRFAEGLSDVVKRLPGRWADGDDTDRAAAE